MTPNNPTQTPAGQTARTDSVLFPILSDLQSGLRHVVDADFARTLERELNAARNEQARWERLTEDANRRFDKLMDESQPTIVDLTARLTAVERERDEARAALDAHQTALRAEKKLRAINEGELTTATARIAELERDGERLDWLEKNECGIEHKGGSGYAWLVFNHEGIDEGAETLRAAIDAARTTPTSEGAVS